MQSLDTDLPNRLESTVEEARGGAEDSAWEVSMLKCLGKTLENWAACPYPRDKTWRLQVLAVDLYHDNKPGASRQRLSMQGRHRLSRESYSAVPHGGSAGPERAQQNELPSKCHLENPVRNERI